MDLPFIYNVLIHFSLFFRVLWLVWDRKTVMWETRLKAREVSWPWSIPLNMELSPTGMIWRKFGIILFTMSFVLPPKNTQYCLQKLLWILRPTERKWHRYSVGTSSCIYDFHPFHPFLSDYSFSFLVIFRVLYSPGISFLRVSQVSVVFLLAFLWFLLTSNTLHVSMGVQ